MTRFDVQPPTFELDSELRWLLLRCFAEDALAIESPADPSRAAALAKRLGVAARIGGRVAPELLLRDLGGEAAAVREVHLSAAGRDALLLEGARWLEEHAARVGVPVIRLKFAALRASGVARPGLREAQDIDVLVPRAHATRLAQVLTSCGASATAISAYPHQLSPIGSPHGVLIEIHLHVPGVRLGPSPRFVTADQMMAAGVLRKVGSVLIPKPALLAAHALAHALLQNLGAPESHHPLRAIADLCDLERAHPGVTKEMTAFLEPELDRDHCEAVQLLCRSLAGGDLDAAQSGPSGSLLRHLLASQLDQRYASSLRLKVISRPLSDEPWPWPHLRAVLHAAFPGSAEFDAIYGPASGPAERVRRRLLRPLDLGLRFARAVIDRRSTERLNVG